MTQRKPPPDGYKDIAKLVADLGGIWYRADADGVLRKVVGDPSLPDVWPVTEEKGRRR